MEILMPPILKNNDQIIPLNPKGYASEDELQAMLAQHPELLQEDTDVPLRTVCREVSMDGQSLDILMVDATGLPVAVEVKLDKNDEIRRKVVGQVLEYAALLSSLTVDELDSITKGSLSETLQMLAEEGKTTFEDLRKACGTHLRAGQVRIIVAVDEAPESLAQILEFLDRRSDLDIRLVRLHKYTLKGGGLLVVPNLLVKPDNIASRRNIDTQLMQVLLAYQGIAPEEFPVWENRASNWRQICPTAWKDLRVHYEFLARKDVIGVEIHIENEKVKPLQELLISIKEHWSAKYPEYKLVYEENWQKCGDRIAILFPTTTDPTIIAETMRDIIEETSAEIQMRLDQMFSRNE